MTTPEENALRLYNELMKLTPEDRSRRMATIRKVNKIQFMQIKNLLTNKC